MANKPLPSPDVLRQLIRYVPDTGKLYWKERGVEWFKDSSKFAASSHCKQWNASHAGNETGFVKQNGYVQIFLRGRNIVANRAIWAIHYGEHADPALVIDHINRCRSDNRIENLRLISWRENAQNKERGKSGLIGASWHKQHQKWYSCITFNRKQVFLGLFQCAEDASEAYRDAEAKIIAGYHPRHPSCATYL